MDWKRTIGEFRSDVEPAGSAVLAALSFSRVARGGLDATMVVVAAALVATVLISELLYRSELAKGQRKPCAHPPA